MDVQANGMHSLRMIMVPYDHAAVSASAPPVTFPIGAL